MHFEFKANIRKSIFFYKIVVRFKFIVFSQSVNHSVKVYYFFFAPVMNYQNCYPDHCHESEDRTYSF